MRRILAPLGWVVGPPIFGLYYLFLRLWNGKQSLTLTVASPPYMLVPKTRGLLATAMTYPLRIFIKGATISDALLTHERVHSVQWARYGVLGFPARYMYELIARGRAGNLLEIEARHAAPGTY